MVHFMYHLDWHWDTQVKHYFWVWVWGRVVVREVGWAFESTDSVNRWSSTIWWASPSLLWENKRWRKEEFTLCFLPFLLCWEQLLSYSLLPLTGIYSPCSQAFGLIPPYFLGFHLADGRGIVGLLSCHNCKRVYISYWFHFFGGSWLIHWRLENLYKLDWEFQVMGLSFRGLRTQTS